MIINDKTNVTTTLSGGTAFGVEKSSKIFKVLSKNIYKNPIMAFIRELTTNAADAHIAAGKKSIPIVVKLPTRLDQSFFVRDYGTGMSLTDLLNIYKTYFKSTKTEDNDSDGFYGLGTKSPLAYSNDFMVEDFFDGVKYSFMAMFDDRDEPQFVPIGEEKTNEPNGIKVTITIKQEDFKRVSDESLRVLSFVSQPVTVLGGDEAYLNQLTGLRAIFAGNSNNIVYQDEDVIVVRSQTVRGLSNIAKYNVIQGNVCYPIDLPTLKSVCPGITFVGGENYKSDNHVYFFRFDRGEIGVPPSREEITYDRLYVERIAKKSGNVVVRLSDDVEKKLRNVNTLLEYSNVILEIKKKFSNDSTVIGGMMYNRDTTPTNSSLFNQHTYSHPASFDILPKLVTVGPVLDDINNTSFGLKILKLVNNVKIPVGNIVMSKSIREKMISAGYKSDDYKANVAHFTRPLSITPAGEIYEKHSTFDDADAGNKSSGVASSLMVGQRSKLRYFVEQDDKKPCTFVHFTRLMSTNQFDNTIFFYDKGQLDIVKMKAALSVYDEFEKIFNNGYTYGIVLRNETSSSVIKEFLTVAANPNAFKGIDINVAEFNTSAIERYYDYHARSFAEMNETKCQAYIANEKYLIVKTYSHEADVTFELCGKKVEIKNKDDLKNIVLTMCLVDPSFMKTYKGLLFIKKTSYEKLEKLSVDMSNTLDKQITEFYKKYNGYFGMSSFKSENSTLITMIRAAFNKKYGSTGKKCALLEQIAELHDNMSNFQSKLPVAQSKNGLANAMRGFKLVEKFVDSNTVSIESLIEKLRNKYRMLWHVRISNSTLSDSSKASDIADYIFANL